MAATRSVLVEPLRLGGWLTRFEKRNGAYTVRIHLADPEPGVLRTGSGAADSGAAGGTGHEEFLDVIGSVHLMADNGCSAVLVPPLPVPLPVSAPRPDATLDEMVSQLLALHEHTVIGLVLIRRGGYSVGVARAGKIIASKTGTRYVQGRTAAGGWSQQRFARRRANQADGLVKETAARAAILFAAHPPSCIQLGGDKALAADTLGEAALVATKHLPRTPFLTVQDPRLRILQDAAGSALSVRITVTDPPDSA